MSPPSFIANFDSASVMALANAHALRREPFVALGQPPAAKPFAKRANKLPRRAREKGFIVSGASETVSPRRLDRLDLEAVGRWLDEEYPPGPYPAVAVGSTNGALTHLYSAMGIPWLPQTLLIPVRQSVHPDDPTAAMERGREPAQRLLDAHPDIALHHMHDANQDRLMVRALTYFRVKRRTLGEAYERFLRERLEPGGTIIVPECRRTWQTTRLGDRYVFQHGALGGATEEEFHRGSERVAEYLARYDSPVRRWDGPEPDTESPEAEWGFAPELLEDIERFAAEHGYRVRRLAFTEPEDPSPLVADLYRSWYRRRGIPANRLVLSSFVVMDPHSMLRTGSVPYWMTFNMQPSLWTRPTPTSTTPSRTTRSTSCCSSTASRPSVCRRSSSGATSSRAPSGAARPSASTSTPTPSTSRTSPATTRRSVSTSPAATSSVRPSRCASSRSSSTSTATATPSSGTPALTRRASRPGPRATGVAAARPRRRRPRRARRRGPPRAGSVRDSTATRPRPAPNRPAERGRCPVMLRRAAR